MTSSSHRFWLTLSRCWWLLLVLVLLAAAVGYFARRPRKEITTRQSPETPFDADALTVVASAIVDSTGGTVSVEGTGTPADGLKVQIPLDALAQEDTISVGYCESSVLIRAGTGCGIILFLRAEHTSSFAQPVVIEVPVDKELFTDLAIPYQVDEEGRLHVMDIAGIDAENLRLSFYTFKPCAFTWVYP